MRDDPLKGTAFRNSKAFEVSTARAAKELAGDFWGKDSLSGHERNRLFLSEAGRQFADVSLFSGADHPGDGRSVVLLDYNHDGLTDIASINTNAPKLVLFKNEIPSTHHFVALRFEGGNSTDEPSTTLSNRDGYGTRVTLKWGERTIVEELRAGEGFSAQNSRTLLIGLGDKATIPVAMVRWPSGREQSFENLPVDRLVIFREGKGDFEAAPYRR